MNEIETLTRSYSDARGVLSDTVAALNFELDQVKRNYLTQIKQQVGKAKERQAELRAAIEANADLFTKPKPRTQIFYGVKVGFRKATGKIQFDDPDQVVKLIRRQFPDQFDVLVKTTETPIKSALEALPAVTLKKLGIEVNETGDVVMIKDAAGEVDKLVAALLKDEAEEIEA
jgi:hypothetical protein